MNPDSPRPTRAASFGLAALTSVLLLATTSGTTLGQGTAASLARGDGPRPASPSIPHGGASVLA